MPESNGNKHRDYSIFDNMSTENLEDILRADFQLPNGEDSDTNAILYIIEVIAKREKEHPTGRFTDVQTAWASFNEHYLPYAENAEPLYDFEDIEEQTGIKQTPFVKSLPSMKNHRLLHIICVIAAITTLLLAGTVTASALGFDLLAAIPELAKDIFGFSNAAANAQITQEPSASSQYKSLQDALDNYDVTAKLAPTWFPEGYSLENIDVNETPAQTIIHAKYSNTSSEISANINIALLKNNQSVHI